MLLPAEGLRRDRPKPGNALNTADRSLACSRRALKASCVARQATPRRSGVPAADPAGPGLQALLLGYTIWQ